MKHQVPTTREAYETAYMANVRITGGGASAATVFACPFCAAPDWNTIRIVFTHEDMSREVKCEVCGRSGAALHTYYSGGVETRYVQTGGPDADPWVPVTRWPGCPASRLMNSVTRQQGFYIDIPNGHLVQMVCTRRHHENDNHTWAPQESMEGRNSRDSDKFTDY